MWKSQRCDSFTGIELTLLDIVYIVQVVSDNRIVMRVWERGVGITQACGSGACAVAVAAAVTRRIQPNPTTHLYAVEVNLEGGDLHIELSHEGGAVWSLLITHDLCYFNGRFMNFLLSE